MKVLVIPENPTLDQHVLKPVVERIFEDLRRSVRVKILTDPHLNGVTEALDPRMVEHITRTYAMTDLFLLIVDRDCIETRIHQLQQREHESAAIGKTLIGCLAIEELEAWPLAVHWSRKSKVKWQDVRANCHPKEAYFEPLVEEQGWAASAGRGRKAAMRELSGSWKRLQSRCPEIRELTGRIGEWLRNRP
ncbi:MAG: hypothetical protein WD066_12330 [Planctomycetaceae bacterium]